MVAALLLLAGAVGATLADDVEGAGLVLRRQHRVLMDNPLVVRFARARAVQRPKIKIIKKLYYDSQ